MNETFPDNHENYEAEFFRRALLRFAQNSLKNALISQKETDRPNIYIMLDATIENPITLSYFIKMTPESESSDTEEIRIFFPKDYFDDFDSGSDELPGAVWYKFYRKDNQGETKTDLLEITRDSAMYVDDEFIDDDESYERLLIEELLVEEEDNDQDLYVDSDEKMTSGVTIDDLSLIASRVNNDFVLVPVKKLRS